MVSCFGALFCSISSSIVLLCWKTLRLFLYQKKDAIKMPQIFIFFSTSSQSISVQFPPVSLLIYLDLNFKLNSVPAPLVNTHFYWYFICVSIYPSVRPSFCPFTCLSIHLSICLIPGARQLYAWQIIRDRMSRKHAVLDPDWLHSHLTLWCVSVCLLLFHCFSRGVAFCRIIFVCQRGQSRDNGVDYLRKVFESTERVF